MINDLVFIPSFSIQPNKICIYNQVFRKDKVNRKLIPIQASLRIKRNNPNNETTFVPLKRSSHNLQISKNAYRALKSKINWLYYLSEPKKIKTYKGNYIYNHRISFITLTLPSIQNHSTSYLNKALLNVFLTEIRQRTKMLNYVWRLEFQKNGNAHWHIVTDTYLDYFLIQKIWNRLLKKEGYIEAYQNKFKNMSLSEYNKKYNSESKVEFKKIASRYAKGLKANWSNPNSVDVKNVQNKNSIASYISKYFGKNEGGALIKNKFDSEDNIKNIRIWYCSRSLSQMKSMTAAVEEVKYDIYSLISFIKEKKEIIHKYCVVIYFDINKCDKVIKSWFDHILLKYAREKYYKPYII